MCKELLLQFRFVKNILICKLYLFDIGKYFCCHHHFLSKGRDVGQSVLPCYACRLIMFTHEGSFQRIISFRIFPSLIRHKNKSTNSNIFPEATKTTINISHNITQEVLQPTPSVETLYRRETECQFRTNCICSLIGFLSFLHIISGMLEKNLYL